MNKIFTFILILFIIKANAQCVPNTSYTSRGAYPSVLTNACVGSPYSEKVTIVFPTDTVLFGFTLAFDSMLVTDVKNLPDGINYSCGNISCKYINSPPTISRGCLLLSGIPTASTPIGNKLKIAITSWVTVPFVGSQTVIDTLLVELNSETCVCVPHETSINRGAYPSILTKGCIDVPYSDTITLVFPQDTVLYGFTLPFDSMLVTDVVNLPAGLNYSCGNVSCKYISYPPTISKGCLLISGTPTSPTPIGNKLKIAVTSWLTVPFVGSQSISDTLIVELNTEACACLPYETSSTKGAYPSVLTKGCLDVPYSDTITLVFPQDTVLYGFTLPFDSMLVTDVVNLPAGLNYSCGNINCKYISFPPAISKGCLLISGTPTSQAPIGNKLKIAITSWLNVPFVGTQSVSDTLLVELNVESCAGIGDFKTSNYKLYPNPAQNQLNIQLKPELVSLGCSIRMYNSMGQLIVSSLLNTENSVVKLDYIANGVYLFLLESSDGIISSERVLIQK
ncbi:MAG: T9SS type A sorting domain-containing protein [Bacteroidota bacterium]